MRRYFLTLGVAIVIAIGVESLLTLMFGKTPGRGFFVGAICGLVVSMVVAGSDGR